MESTRIYRAAFSSYALWLSLFSLPLVPLAFCFAKFGWSQFEAKGLLAPTLLILAAQVATIIWLSRYRLVFTPEGISYRSWRAAWNVPYAGVTQVLPSRATPIAKLPIGVYVYLKGGRRELVYTKAFPMAAIKDLFSAGPNSSSKRTGGKAPPAA